MGYADLPDEDVIQLAVECVGRGVKVPSEVASRLGSSLMADILNPGDINELDKHYSASN